MPDLRRLTRAELDALARCGVPAFVLEGTHDDECNEPRLERRRKAGPWEPVGGDDE